MNMRRFIEIIEGVSGGPDDLSYYMEEGCGTFAVALSLANPGGDIGILSRRDGEEYNDDFPYEITHVFYSRDGLTYDAKGQRTLDAMAADFHMAGDYDVKGPWSPREFEARFIGDSDEKPLFGDASDIKEALGLILAHADFYGVAAEEPTQERDPAAPSR